MSDVIPPLPDDCWPVDIACCDGFEDYSPLVQERAQSLAAQTLRMLTGFRVGGCPITVRPCSPGCVSGADGWYAWGPGWRPAIDTMGQWVNSCGCLEDCNHLGARSLVLPGPVGPVSEVLIDGEVLSPTAYRVDNWSQIVRTDGEVWPKTQDMTADPDGAGAFAITYLRGIPVDALGSYAAGILACEFAKSCCGQECRLPDGVTSITRLGVSMEIEPGMFTSGMTGIREVDVYIQRWNPNGMKAPSQVWSPDLPTMRTTTARGC